MKKCNRCGVLLLDSDPECTRCHAPVDVTLSPEEAREKRQKEVSAWRKKRLRISDATGAYIPPWLAPVLVFTCGFGTALFITLGAQRKAEIFSVDLLIGGTVISLVAIMITAVALYYLMRGEGITPPTFEQSLITASLMAAAVSLFGLILTFVPFIKESSTKAGLRVLMIFLVVRMSGETGIGKSLIAMTVCGIILVGGTALAWTIFDVPGVVGGEELPAF
jgi:hypothetical protein